MRAGEQIFISYGDVSHYTLLDRRAEGAAAVVAQHDVAWRSVIVRIWHST